MKRFVISAILMLVGSLAQADPVRVPGIWGFAPGSTQGSYFRAILDQANANQKKYEFVFDHKPGAGGVISTRAALNHKGPAILAHTGAIFAQTYVLLDPGYRIDQFRPILIMAEAPSVLVTKGKTLDQLLKQPRISIGGVGAALAAEVFRKNAKHPDVVVVPFKDTNEAFLAVLGGHVDLTFEFLGDAKAKAGPDTAFVGLTGNRSVENLPLLKDRGFPEAAMLGAPFAIYVPTTMPLDQYNEIRTILLEAEKSEKVQSLYRRDFSVRETAWLQTSNLLTWYEEKSRQYKILTGHIKPQ